MEKQSFLRDHADTLAIIGVNVAIFAFLASFCISNSQRIDASNARSDFLSNQIIELIKDGRARCNSWRPYEDFIPAHDARSRGCVVPQPTDWMIVDPSVKPKDTKQGE